MSGKEAFELFLALPTLVMEIIIYSCWVYSLYKRKNSPPIDFNELELAAALIWLVPFYVCVVVILQSRGKEYPLNTLDIVGLMCFQILGIVSGRIMAQPRDHSVMPRRLNRFWWTFFGALKGTLVAYCAYHLACMNCVAVIMGLPFMFHVVLGPTQSKLTSND